MNRKTLAALIFISLVVSGCAFLSSGYVKPGLDIRDERVGLEVIEYIRPGSVSKLTGMDRYAQMGLSSLGYEPTNRHFRIV